MRKKIMVVLIACISLLLFGTVYANDTGETTSPVVKGHSLTVSGKDISVNFYVELETTDENSTGKIKMSLNNDETTIKTVDLENLATAVENGEVQQKDVLIDAKYHTCYAFSYPVVAKKMDAKVSLSFSAADGQETVLDEYCVNDYIEQVTESQGYALKFEEFAKSMGVYGQFAKYYFSNVSATDEEMTSLASVTYETLAEYAIKKGSNFDSVETLGCTYYGYSLTLESETSLNLYFKVDEQNASDFTFAIVSENGGQETYDQLLTETTVKNGTELYVIRIPEIGANELGTKYTIKCKYGENTYEYITDCSALSYAYTVLNKYDNESSTTYGQKVNLVNVSKALYLYYESATAYLAAEAPEVYDLYYSATANGFYADPECSQGVKINAETNELQLTGDATTEVTSFAQLNGTRVQDCSVWMMTSYEIASDEKITGPYVIRRYSGNVGNILNITAGTATVNTKVNGSYAENGDAYIARYPETEASVSFASGVYQTDNSEREGACSLVYVTAGGKLVLGENGVLANNYISNDGTGEDVGRGGGIYSTGTVEISGTVVGSYASHSGGNVYMAGGILTIDSKGAMRNGEAHYSGGNIRVQAGTLTINGGTVSGGYAGVDYSLGQGGNIRIENGATAELNSGVVCDGIASYQGGNVFVVGNLTVTGGGTIYGGKTSTEDTPSGGKENVYIDQFQDGTYLVQLQSCTIDGLSVNNLDQPISINAGTIIQAPEGSDRQGMVVDSSTYTGTWLSMTEDYSLASVGGIEVTATTDQIGTTVMEKGIALTDRARLTVTSGSGVQFMFEENGVTLQNVAEHIHCACDGMSTIGASDCKSGHWDKKWTEVSKLSGSTKEDGGYYYLSGDVQDGGTWNLDNGANVSICLNDATYTGNTRAAILVNVNGSLTLCNGTVAAQGSIGNNAGCLKVNNNASLTLYGVHLDGSGCTLTNGNMGSALWYHMTDCEVKAFNSTYKGGYETVSDGTTQKDSMPVCKINAFVPVDGLTDQGATSSDETGILTMMGNNIRQAYIDENDYKWDGILPVERYKLLYAAYAHYMPDVVAFQECDEYWHDLIDNIDGKATRSGVKAFSELGYADATAGKIDYNIRAVRNVIYYNTNTLEVVDAGYETYPRCTNGTEEDSVTPWCFTWAILKSKTTGEKFAVSSTHIISAEGDADVKAEQVGVIVEYMKAIETEYEIPVIMMGDYNMDPTYNAYQAFEINTKLYSARDVATVVEGKEYKTTNTKGEVPNPTDDSGTGVIDHCMISMTGISADKYQILVEEFDTEKGIHTYDYSDHVPQRLTFRIGE